MREAEDQVGDQVVDDQDEEPGCSAAAKVTTAEQDIEAVKTIVERKVPEMSVQTLRDPFIVLFLVRLFLIDQLGKMPGRAKVRVRKMELKVRKKKSRPWKVNTRKTENPKSDQFNITI